MQFSAIPITPTGSRQSHQKIACTVKLKSTRRRPATSRAIHHAAASASIMREHSNLPYHYGCNDFCDTTVVNAHVCPHFSVGTYHQDAGAHNHATSQAHS